MAFANDLGQFADSEGRDVRDTLAKQGPIAAIGRATRSVATAPMAVAGALANQTGTDLRDAAAPVGGGIRSFAGGLTGVGTSSKPTTPLPGTPPAPPPTTITAGMPEPDSNSTMRGTLGAAAPSNAPQSNAASANAPAANDDIIRPSNVRAYLRPPRNYQDQNAPSAPTVDPAAFASNIVTMKNVDPSASIGQATDANVSANTYAKNFLQALREAQGGYTGETGRISALANSNLAGAHAEEAGARTEDAQAGSAIKRYSLEQQQSLQAMTSELSDLHQQLADPKLPPDKRTALEGQLRNKEMQLWIIHGKPPRPDNRYQAIPGKFNPATGTFEQGVVIDRTTGKVQSMEGSGANAGNASPGTAAPAAAIDHLRQNPGLAAQFDAKYGQGASQRALQSAQPQ